jgi:hypothetical protein
MISFLKSVAKSYSFQDRNHMHPDMEKALRSLRSQGFDAGNGI